MRPARRALNRAIRSSESFSGRIGREGHRRAEQSSPAWKRIDVVLTPEAILAKHTRAKAEAAAAGTPTESARPDPKAQYNFTDPESRIMKGPDGFVQAYNVQVAVDELQLIVGQAVTQATNDKKQLMPMITTIEQQSGDTPTQLLADAGYCSDENLTAIADTTIDAYISTRKQTHGERLGPCPRGPLPKTATIVDRMTPKLPPKTGAAVHARAKGN